MSLQTSLRTLARTYSRGEHLVSDAELLARFGERRDDESFRGLVERHGSMVKAVCRRTCRDEHAAEDAFQATFLTLARQAGRIRRPEALPGWLYKVAHSCGLKARRKRPTLPVDERPDPSTDPLDRISGRELLEIVDGEIIKLPEAHRSALIVCTIEGLTVEEAAKRLKATTGAVRGWLERGREMLRKRLAARKIELSAVLVTLSAASSGRLTAGQIEAVVGVVNQGSGLIPSVVSSLTSSRVSAAWTGIAATVVAGVIGGALMAVPKTVPNTPVVPVHTFAAEPVPKQKADQGVILFTRAGKPHFIDPDGTNERPITIPDQEAWAFIPSPDGRFIAFSEKNILRVHDTKDVRNEKKFKIDGVIMMPAVWSPKGDEIAVTIRTDKDTTRNDNYAHFVVNYSNGKISQLSIPKTHVLTDWSSKDGQFLVTSIREKTKKSFAGYLQLWSRDGKTEKKITAADGDEFLGQLSPDGTRVLFWNPVGPTLQWYKIDQPELVTTVALESKIVVPSNYCWSPDGRRIAFIWAKRDPNIRGQGEEGLCIANPDGSNPVHVIKKAFDKNGSISGLSWVKSP